MPADPIPVIVLLEVRETNERMVFEVRSEKHPKIWYRVDLLSFGGMGGCACKNFNTRMSRARKEGKPMMTEVTDCKHIFNARRHVNLLQFPAMAAREECA